MFYLSNLSILFHKTSFCLLLFLVAYFVGLPLDEIEFFVMIIDSYELFDYFWVVWDSCRFANVDIREVWPAWFWSTGFVIYYKIIAKGWAVLRMHSYRKLSLKWLEFEALQIFWCWKEESAFTFILKILPIFCSLPRNATIAADNVSELCFCNG